MFATLFSVALFVTLAIQGVFADFSIDTPNLTQCAGALITWTASSPPYSLLVASADDLCGEALVDLGQQTGLSYQWNVDLASGTAAVLFIEDSQGNEAWSGTMIVGASSDSSCLTSTTTPTTSSLSSPVVSSTGAVLPATPAKPTPTPTGSSGGAANAGSSPSGALSIRPLSALTSIGSGLFALFALAV